MGSRKIGILALGVLAWAVLCIPGYEDVVSYVWNAAKEPVVTLDAGHGGIDGGAESADGVAEKDINLSIARFLKDGLEAEGVRVVMTREDENGLYGDSQEGAIRTLKTRDMHERKRIIDETSADLTVSIHLNSFTEDPSVKGAQVFYPSSGGGSLTEDSKKAAEIIQKGLNEMINGEKPRTELGKDDVYLLQDVRSPIIIAECGFLSNPQDLEKLRTEQWQKTIADALGKGICKFLEEQEGNT